jgi:hypothetical protein
MNLAGLSANTLHISNHLAKCVANRQKVVANNRKECHQLNQGFDNTIENFSLKFFAGNPILRAIDLLYASCALYGCFTSL